MYESKVDGTRKCERDSVLPPDSMTVDMGSDGKSDDSTFFLDKEGNSSRIEEKCSASKTMTDVVIMGKKKKEKMPVAVSKDFPGPHTAELSKIERIGVISVLEDCTDQLYILRKTNRTKTFPTDLKYRSLKERFSDRERMKVEVEDIEGKAGTLRDSKKMIKLQRDRARLEEVLQIALDELSFKNSFKTLVEISKFEGKKQSEEAELISTEEKNVKKLNNLCNILKTEFKEGMDKINEKHDTVVWLKDEIQETLFMNDLKFKYVSKWESAREEQNHERLSLSEKILEDQLTDLKDNIDMEMRCHVEIEMYMKQATVNLEEEIKNRMEKYDIELEDRADDLQRLQAKRAVKCKELEDLVLLYQQRKNEIDAYLAHKEKEAAKAAHEAYLYCMATVIQAWWRGTMVRRRLGPYKKSKKGKERKGKGRKEGIKKKV